MPKTIGELLKNLLIKAGVKVDENEALVNELAAPTFSALTVSEDLEKGIDNGLLSLEQAKNNHPEIKKHYTALAYNGLDSELSGVMEELQIPDDVKAVILNERSSTKRAGMLTKKVKELEEKKKQSTSDTTRDSLQQTINKLNADLASEKAGVQKLKDDYEEKIKNIHKDARVESILGGYKTVYDELPPDVKINALKALVQKALQDSDAELKVDDKGQLTLLRKDGSNVFSADNRPLNPQLLIDQTLANNKVLKVTDSKGQIGQQNNNSQQQNGQNQNSIIEGNGNNVNGQGKKVDTILSGLVKQQLADLEQK